MVRPQGQAWTGLSPLAKDLLKDQFFIRELKEENMTVGYMVNKGSKL